MIRKKLKPLVLMLGILLFLCINNSFASPLWQFGIDEAADGGIGNSDEYLQVTDYGTFAPSLSFNLGNVSNDEPVFLYNPTLPGYLYDKNPTPDYAWVETFAVGMLSFEFTLEIDYVELDLFYGRFGSEIDNIFLDGELVASVDGIAEGQWDLFTEAITLPGNATISSGAHTLSIAYGGGDAANGHYIDFIRLENGTPSAVPEPATFVLLGIGLLSLAGFGRKNLKK